MRLPIQAKPIMRNRFISVPLQATAIAPSGCDSGCVSVLKSVISQLVSGTCSDMVSVIQGACDDLWEDPFTWDEASACQVAVVAFAAYCKIEGASAVQSELRSGIAGFCSDICSVV